MFAMACIRFKIKYILQSVCKCLGYEILVDFYFIVSLLVARIILTLLLAVPNDHGWRE